MKVLFESFGAVSYSPSVVTMAVYLTVYEIFKVGSKYIVTLKTGLRVVQVTENGVVQ